MPVIDLGRVIGPQGPQGETGAQGIRGEQGLPGPNQVTNSTATPLTGVLTGNGSVVGIRSIDATPTANSDGIPTSGGVKAALEALLPSTLDYKSESNPVIQSGNGTAVLRILDLPAGIYLFSARLALPASYVGFVSLNAYGANSTFITSSSADFSQSAVAKNVSLSGICKSESTFTLSFYSLGYGSGVVNGSLVECYYYKLK